MTHPRKYVAQTARLLATAEETSPPVNLEKIAANLRLKIESVPLEDEYSGFLAVQEKTIAVNSVHSATRQRFTIAHEIAHYILHRRKQSPSVFIDRAIYRRHAASADLNHEEEVAANAFAAELLMPEKWLDQYMEDHPLDLSETSNINILADEFRVSKKAMEYRLHNLGFVISI